MSTSNNPHLIDCCAGYQRLRSSVRGKAGVNKYVTGHHYSEVVYFDWPNFKRHQTRKIHQYDILIGSINTATMKDPCRLDDDLLICVVWGLKVNIVCLHTIKTLEK